MKTLIILSMLIWLFSINLSHAATVYKCKNAEGKLLYQKVPCDENTKEVHAWTPKNNAPKTRDPIVIQQGVGGHYFIDAEVDNRPLTFVIDTGASVVSLPQSFAKDMPCNNTVSMDTANGRTDGCATKIAKLKLGYFVFNDIVAVIVPNLNQPLLGMNVLKNFDIQQKDGQMRLSER